MRKGEIWKSSFEAELQSAEAARRQGNEGRARVCARRAAGIVIREYLRRQGTIPAGPSAYDLLKHFQGTPGMPARLYEVSSHFLARINTEWQLPVQADLIAEARWLAAQLLEPEREDL